MVIRDAKFDALLEIMKGISETNDKINEMKELLEEKLNRIIELLEFISVK